MRVNIVLHRTSELDDWEEEVRKAVEGKVSPLELSFTWVWSCFDVLEGIDTEADLNVVVLAPRKELGAVVVPVVDRLMEEGVKLFFAWYEDAPSALEDFIDYLLHLLGVRD